VNNVEGSLGPDLMLRPAQPALDISRRNLFFEIIIMEEGEVRFFDGGAIGASASELRNDPTRGKKVRDVPGASRIRSVLRKIPWFWWILTYKDDSLIKEGSVP
jgi:hypothetical protein